MLDINLIHSYEHNPRRSGNPEYDRIKSSIRHNGLDQPLVVTQRPKATDYLVCAGGNTRLKILKELVAETGDSSFARVPCVITPWRSESAVLLAHLRENELRGELSFIDKAQAVFEAKSLIEEEIGVDDLTHKDLVAYLRAAGYGIGESLVSQMAYAVRVLLPLLPKALTGGLGTKQVMRIRALERAANALWEKHVTDAELPFDDVFAELCRRYDDAEWDISTLQSAIENEIAQEAEESLQTIRIALDAQISGRTVDIPEFEPIKAPPNSQPCRESDRDAEVELEQADTEHFDSENKEADVENADDETTGISPWGIPADEMDDDPPSIDKGPALPGDLKTLRGRAWTLASRLAQRNGIGDLVEPVSGQGLGYVLRDIPDPALADQLDEEALAQICVLWWQLAACAEMTFAPIESIAPSLPTDSVLRRALVDQDAELLFNSIWTLDPGHTGVRLWQVLHDRDWNDLVGLMETYRRIRRLAAEIGVKLWEPA